VTALLALGFVISSIQAPTGPSAGELAAMKKLDFLVGKWEGTGTMMFGPSQKESFKGSETVQRKLQGKALLVEGKFTDAEGGAVVHETLAVITYDEAAKKYRFQTHLFNRPSGEFELHVTENGFWWEIEVPGSPKVKFTMTLSEQGDWVEIGEVTLPNVQVIKTLEMKLKKVG
jgi:hypothetical protein